jgi:hypothetical protein
MPRRMWSLREWVSRLLAGAVSGCGLLLAADMLFLIPVWGPRLLKPDPRWETVFWVATFGVPASVLVGALAGLVLRRSRELRLSRGQLVACCLVVALVSQLLRPVVSRVRRGGIGPLYEVVPDILAASFCVVAVVIVVWPVGSRLPAPDAEPGAAADRGRT